MISAQDQRQMIFTNKTSEKGKENKKLKQLISNKIKATKKRGKFYLGFYAIAV